MKTGNDHYHLKQEALLSQIEIQERSLKLFEKTIYENVGQILSLAKLELFTIDPEELNESKLKINNSRKLIGKAIHDLRHIAKQLSPKDIIEKGFAYAIEYELQRIKYWKNCDTDFKSSDASFRLDQGRELIVFSILQELVQGILLLQVSKLIITMHYSAELIEVKIIHQNKDTGLLSMDFADGNVKLNNRLKLIGAKLIIENLHGSGMIFIRIKK